MADLVEEHSEDLHLLAVVDMGWPIGPGGSAAGGLLAEQLRYYAGWPTKIHGETVPNSAKTSMFTYTLKEPVGVCGAIIPWNGPARFVDRQDPSGARDRLHGGAETG